MYYKEWLNDWMTHYVMPSAKMKTIAYYNTIIERHIVPDIGDYGLEELSPLLLQQYVTKLLKSGNKRNGAGLAPNTVNSIITVIQSSLKQAQMVGVTTCYSANQIKRPKTKGKEASCFTIEEQKKIEKYILEKKKPKLVGILLSLYTGLRVGELLSLEWMDVDLCKGEINISKTCHDSYVNGKYIRVYESPKTDSSKRVIPIPRQLMPILKACKKENQSKWVVGNGDKVVSVRSYQSTFTILLKRLNIPHRGFHSLRHTFATRALECGMDVKTLSEILGHKSPVVTLNKYVHSLIDHKRDMMNKVGKLL